MSLLEKTDSEIQQLATPMLTDSIQGGNNKDWALFSKYMPAEEASDPDIRADVEQQWEEHEYLTRFSSEFEFLGVIRKASCVVVLFKLHAMDSAEQYLEQLYLEEIDGEVKQIGIWTD